MANIWILKVGVELAIGLVELSAMQAEGIAPWKTGIFEIKISTRRPTPGGPVILRWVGFPGIIHVHVQGDPDFALIVDALCSETLLFRRRQRRQQQRRQDGNDCYDHQQFNQRKTGPIARQSP